MDASAEYREMTLWDARLQGLLASSLVVWVATRLPCWGGRQLSLYASAPRRSLDERCFSGPSACLVCLLMIALWFSLLGDRQQWAWFFAAATCLYALVLHVERAFRMNAILLVPVAAFLVGLLEFLLVSWFLLSFALVHPLTRYVVEVFVGTK